MLLDLVVYLFIIIVAWICTIRVISCRWCTLVCEVTRACATCVNVIIVGVAINSVIDRDASSATTHYPVMTAMIHMRNLLGWLETRLAQIALNHIKLFKLP